MIEIRSRHLEQDLLGSGTLELFGYATDGMKTLNFADRDEGYFAVEGGLVGAGRLAVCSESIANCVLKPPDSSTIRYEKIASGDMGVGHDGRSTKVDLRTALIVGPGEVEYHHAASLVPSVGIAAMLSQEHLDQFLSQAGEVRLGSVRSTVIEGSGGPALDAALAALISHATTNMDRYRKGQNGRLGELMEALIIESFAQLLIDIGAVTLQPRSHRPAATVVRRAQEYMRANLQDPLTIADVAEAAGVSLRYLQVSFKQIVGCTPRAFLTARRLEAARERMLVQPTRSVTEIAGECGIAHLGRFAQEYRRRFGERPSETLNRSRMPVRNEQRY